MKTQAVGKRWYHPKCTHPVRSVLEIYTVFTVLRRRQIETATNSHSALH